MTIRPGTGELAGVTLVDAHGWRRNQTIRWQDGTIVDIRKGAGGRGDAAPGDVLIPGLVDIHLHGAFGHSFAGPGGSTDGVGASGGAGAADPPATLLTELARSGVTSVVASLVSAPVPDLITRTHELAGWCGRRPGAAELLGVHLEGPFLAPEQRGAHALAALSQPTAADVEALVDRVGSGLTMITVAPELPGAIALIRALSAAGCVVAVGHSAATAQELRSAIDAGARHVTHLWSGMTQVHRLGPWRQAGLVEACLVSDGITAEVIADLKHLPLPLLELARRCLGDRLVVVSDASPAAGLPEGTRFELGNVRCVVQSGVGMVADQDSLAGSTTLLAHMVRTLVRAGWPLPEVVGMASSTPAGVVGVGDRKGRLVRGHDADMVLLDADLQVRRVWTAGHPVC